jgi:hypothetical protein
LKNAGIDVDGRDMLDDNLRKGSLDMADTTDE